MNFPEITGPIEGGLPPWGAPSLNLAALGYTVEEYQLAGTATGFTVENDYPDDGCWQSRPCVQAPYRTRILVVRPIDPARFNGTVIVNWQNVSAGYELGRATSPETYRGYAWVGVSAQQMGVYGLPASMARRMGGSGQPLMEADPERYGQLQHPGDQASFDIFAQAGRVLAPDRSASIDPLGGLKVKRLIAAGASQSAMRLVSYINGMHHHGRVFHGFLLSVWEGRAPRLEDGFMAMGKRTAIRVIDEPIMIVNSEFEATGLADNGVADRETLRVWEVAGTPHGVSKMPGEHKDSRGWVINRLSYAPVYDAALRAMHHWLSENVAAPRQPRIKVDNGISRDEQGNALGGIRLPELAAPTHAYKGSAFGTGRAPLFGAARPFDREQLLALYPDRECYLNCWRRAVEALVASGAILPEAMPDLLEKGEQIDFWY